MRRIENLSLFIIIRSPF